MEKLSKTWVLTITLVLALSSFVGCGKTTDDDASSTFEMSKPVIE